MNRETDEIIEEVIGASSISEIGSGALFKELLWNYDIPLLI